MKIRKRTPWNGVLSSMDAKRALENRKKRSPLRMRAVAFSSLLIPMMSFAASQGHTGAASTGILNVLVGIGDSVRISNLRDISGVYNGVDDIFGRSPACVYRNATGAYTIKGLGSGNNGQFVVSDGANEVSFSVTYDDGTGSRELVPGNDLKGRTGADRFSTTCANTGNNGVVAVGISATDLARVPAGNYVGTLALIVAPE